MPSQRHPLQQIKRQKGENLKRIFNCFFCLNFIVLSSGCASILHGSTEQIYVVSKDPSARIFINNELVGKGSAKATVRKKHLDNATIYVRKEGCKDAAQPIKTTFDGTTLLGLFIDLGIISILVVDFAISGATTRAETIHYFLDPNCESETPTQ